MKSLSKISIVSVLCLTIFLMGYFSNDFVNRPKIVPDSIESPETEVIQLTKSDMLVLTQYIEILRQECNILCICRNTMPKKAYYDEHAMRQLSKVTVIPENILSQAKIILESTDDPICNLDFRQMEDLILLDEDEFVVANFQYKDPKRKYRSYKIDVSKPII